MAPPSLCALDSSLASDGVHVRSKGTICPGLEQNTFQHDLGPTNFPPSEPSSLADRPAFVVALVLTGLILLLGFSASICSGRLWKKDSKKNTDTRKANSQSYLRNTVAPFPYIPSPTPSPPFISEFKPSVNDEPRMNEVGMSPFTSSRPKSWCPPWTSPYVQGLNASSVRLFSVPEVDEEMEGDSPTDPPREDGEASQSYRPSIWAGRQNSEESHSTEPTVNDVELFDIVPGASDTSCTSFEAPGDNTDDDDEGTLTDEDIAEAEVNEIVFEVKRGQTRSLELVKGVLVVVPPESTSSKDSRDLGAMVQPSNHAKKDSVQISKTVPNILIQQSSYPDISADLPSVIVTQPSTLSLVTVESSASSMSMDLSTFPLPPVSGRVMNDGVM